MSKSTRFNVMPSKPKSNSRQQLYLNPVKVRLQRGETVIGATISVNNVEVAVQAANLGFDFLWLEMEHAPLSLETVRNIVLGTRGLPAVPFARPAVNELWTAKQLLDTGVLGMIFPFTSTPALARQAAAACHYPTRGLRGSGAAFAAFRWSAAANYYDFADANVLVVAVIEDTPGLSHIDEIAATPGIDVVFIGTSDLSFSLGLRGEQNHPKLEAAIAKIVAAAQQHGKFLGRPGLTPAAIRKFRRQGFQFFQSCTDIELMAAGAQALLKPLGRARAKAFAGGI